MKLALHLALDKNKVTKDKLPEATVRLINEGEEMVVVNGRLLLAPAGFPARLHELEFDIKGPAGSVNLKKIRVNAGPPQKENFVRLFPGEYVFISYELSGYFKYETRGKYIITATYSNDTQVVVHDKKSWTGKLKSNEAHFEITG